MEAAVPRVLKGIQVARKYARRTGRIWFFGTLYPGKLGVIDEGAYADMLLVNGNSLEDIQLVGHPETSFVLIMKDGTIYRNIPFE